MTGKERAVAVACQPLSHACPLCVCARVCVCVCRYEEGLLIAVTATLGGALLAKGFDSLVRPGAPHEHAPPCHSFSHTNLKTLSLLTLIFSCKSENLLSLAARFLVQV